jgi:hypothetical protein
MIYFDCNTRLIAGLNVRLLNDNDASDTCTDKRCGEYRDEKGWYAYIFTVCLLPGDSRLCAGMTLP